MFQIILIEEGYATIISKWSKILVVPEREDVP